MLTYIDLLRYMSIVSCGAQLHGLPPTLRDPLLHLSHRKAQLFRRLQDLAGCRSQAKRFSEEHCRLRLEALPWST